MLRKKLSGNLLLTIIWLAAVTLWRWDWQWNLIFLWLGGLSGTFLLDIDHLLDIFFVHPSEEAKTQILSLLRQRKVREAVSFTADTATTRGKFVFHSALFQVFLVVLSFWVLTSSNSLLGKGLVMAMALHLLKDEFKWLLEGKEEFLRQRLFWPIKREVNFPEQKIFIILMLLVFLGLNLLLI